MAGKRILYISGSFGLGHVTRDLAIAGELRRLVPGVEIRWLAADPASRVLREAGEDLVPEAGEYANDTGVAEGAASGSQLNLVRYTFEARDAWLKNVSVFQQVTERERFDAVVADEAYEVQIALLLRPKLRKFPFVMIYDFLGLDSVTSNPLEKLGVYLLNRLWSLDYRVFSGGKGCGVFVGELEDVPEKSFGFMMSSRRKHARTYFNFVGYIFPFKSEDYADKTKLRAKLGYGGEPLVVCSIGGTAIGRELLELCGKSYPMVRREFPDLRMVLVCGPRISPDSLDVPDGVEVRGYVPALYEHFAASDLAIVQGGGTTTLELTALRRPFIFFPVEGMCEQEVTVAGRLARHGAGVKMVHSRTTPQSLAGAIVANLGKEVTYPPIPSDGATRAAQMISRFL